MALTSTYMWFFILFMSHHSHHILVFSISWVKNDHPFKYDPIPMNYGKGRILVQIGDTKVVVNSMVVVDPKGGGNFPTIGEAIAAAPNNTKPNTGYFGIHVVKGKYNEYVNIPTNKEYLLMLGDGINRTVIYGNRSNGTGSTTYESATFAVSATGFVAINMTIQNTAGPSMGQAVALRNAADLSAFHRCSIDGYQDTLLAHAMRQFYKECDIYGTVDFIFGNAAAVFQDCNIYVKQPLKGQYNTITAQGRTDPNQNTGFSFQRCNIMATPDLISSNFTVQTYLGRPWMEYSRTVFTESFLDSLIDPSGWHEWNGNFALETLYYGEYKNSGPGSNTAKRVKWLGYHVIDESIASYFTVTYLIVGEFWLPSTGIPFTEGLGA